MNKMLFDLGSGTQLPILGDPTEKINFLGLQLEDLKSRLEGDKQINWHNGILVKPTTSYL